MGRDWAHLVEDLLIIIAMRIECLQDLVIFSAVCPSWRTVYSKMKSLWTPRVPWLMLTENVENNPSCIRTVFDPAARKQYQMELPETFGRYCHGCEDGWIFTLGLDMEMHLFNPHTRTRLRLPSVETLPFVDPFGYLQDAEHRVVVRMELIKRVVVLKTRSSSEILIMLVYANSLFAFTKPEDSSWRVLKGVHQDLPYVRDVVPYGDYAMFLYEDGTVAAFDVDSFLLPDQSPQEAKVYVPANDTEFVEVYLTQFGGDLIVLQERFILVDPAIGLMSIHVHMFKFDFKTREWKQIDELGDVALFVGNNSSIAVRPSESNACKPNCIYFSEARFPFYEIKAAGKDMEVLSMEDFYVGDMNQGDGVITTEFCPPFWYTPKLA